MIFLQRHFSVDVDGWDGRGELKHWGHSLSLKGVGAWWSLRSLPTQAILWFYDTMITTSLPNIPAKGSHRTDISSGQTPQKDCCAHVSYSLSHWAILSTCHNHSPTTNSSPPCPLNHIPQSPIYPPLEQLQGRRLYHLPGQSAPMPHYSFYEDFFSSYPTWISPDATSGH